MFTRRYDGVRLIIIKMVEKNRALFRELTTNRKVELYMSEVDVV